MVGASRSGAGRVAEIKELAYGFEAIKYALRQNKEGVAITLVVDPNNIPRDLLNDDIGQRYMVGMGKISDGEEIIEGDNAREAKRLLISCGALCRDSDFQRWIEDNGFSMEASEEAAAAAVRGLLKVKSRAEIKTDEEALGRFKRLRDLFIRRSTFEEADL
jgi:hypothetical protein